MNSFIRSFVCLFVCLFVGGKDLVELFLEKRQVVFVEDYRSPYPFFRLSSFLFNKEASFPFLSKDRVILINPSLNQETGPI